MSENEFEWLSVDMRDAKSEDLREQKIALETLLASLGWRIACLLWDSQREARSELLDQPIKAEEALEQEFTKGEKATFKVIQELIPAHLEAIETELQERKPADTEDNDDE